VDIWLGVNALKDQYSNLYNIARRENGTVSTILSTRPLNVCFRRSLLNENLNSWHNLVFKIANIHLNEQSNIFKWSLTPSGQFFVRLMYQALLDIDIVSHNINLCRIKIPLKIKVFCGFYIGRQYSPRTT
jgi:hypothetical protein